MLKESYNLLKPICLLCLWTVRKIVNREEKAFASPVTCYPLSYRLHTQVNGERRPSYKLEQMNAICIDLMHQYPTDG